IPHIGTHGYSDPTARGMNGLVLAASPDDPASGLLTPDDLTLYHFDNELVVISGCETGQGLLLEGEGIMSLARAFLASGAKAALASLWPVSDRASALFMGRFYRALLQERATPAQAL